MMRDPDLAALDQLLLERSVRRGDFVLASGRRSSFYVDARLTTMSAQGLVLIGRVGLQAIRARGWTPEAVGGLTMGADPVAYAIAAASAGSPPLVQAFSVRKEAKSHGTGRRIEGNFGATYRVVVVEDVLTTGGSAKQAVTSVQEEGGHVLGVLTVVDRDEGGREALQSQGIEVVSLTTSIILGLR
ncbi:MAG TPA: orotate phosphoribosyltransferase [Gemmatimonadales bacterium]|nr:orotate phosphoribosyltransferase [Gemmatimonadales bacterium]